MGGILIIKVVLFFCFGHKGASLFSKRNTRWPFRAILVVKMGLNLVGLVPDHSRGYPVMHLDFFDTRGPSLLRKRNPKMAILRAIRCLNGMKVGRIDPRT